ncbi:MAG: YuzF family protein [Oscillospiraceae bacterium]|nr:YuzF family protein [Oscillospiraceae bacterium]
MSKCNHEHEHEHDHLRRELRRLKGQHVRIFTVHDRFEGILIEVEEDDIEIIDRCNRIIMIEIDMIVAVEEPQTRLREFCEDEEEEEEEEEEHCHHHCDD